MTKNEIIWEDATSYTCDGRQVQSAWQYNNNYLRIFITNNHRNYPGKWVMNCHSLGINTTPFALGEGVVSVEDAQAIALNIVRQLARDIAESLN